MNQNPAPKRTQRVTRRITTPPAKPLSIILADDDPWMLELMKRHLRMLNHTVIGLAKNGTEIIAMAKQLKPDLVILDINMPGIDGIQAAREILADQNVSLIFSTGAIDEKTLNRVQEMKIGAYLVKPFSPAQLKAAIFVASSRHREESARSTNSAA